MHPAANQFFRQFAAVVALCVFTVMLTAFLFVPPALGFYPGDAPAAGARHMT